MSVPAKVRAAVSDGDKTLGCRREVADLLSEGGIPNGRRGRRGRQTANGITYAKSCESVIVDA